MLRDMYWLVQPTLIVAEFHDLITLDDCQRSAELLRRLWQPGTTPHLILDVRQRTGFAGDLLNYAALLKLAQSIPPLGWLTIVDPVPNLLIQFTGEQVANHTDLRFRVFTTFVQACHFLQSVDPLLRFPPEDHGASV